MIINKGGEEICGNESTQSISILSEDVIISVATGANEDSFKVFTPIDQLIKICQSSQQ
jgi:hypothetical protein